jgi:hypothetical protein
MPKQSQEPDALRAPDADDDEISLRPYFATLWSYRRFMGIALLVVFVLFLLGAMASYLSAPSERNATIEFRLLFDGADKGQYPNGTKFSATEIVGTPVLTEVFAANGLGRFGRFKDFKDSLFIQQSNPELDLLSYEYQAKLADTKLTPVDRARIEEEFRKKRESLSDPQFSLSLRRHERLKAMPRSLMEKVLNDTLVTWARQADERRGVTKYNIPVFSRNILDRSAIDSEDYLVGIDILRGKTRRIIDSIDQIAKLPGAEIMRAGKEKVSLAEVRSNLEDIVRFKLEPLLGLVQSEGISKNPHLLGLYVEGQLVQIKLQRQEAASRAEVLQNSLREYMSQRAWKAVSQAQPGGEAGGTRAGRTAAGIETPAMIPQFGESFLDRLVELSTQTQTSDVKYRQELTDRVIEESHKVPALDRETGYYENLARAVKGLGSRPSGSDTAVGVIRARLDDAFNGIAQAVDQLASIYDQLSEHNLNPSTLLYTITGPFSEGTQRSLTMRTLAFYAVFVMILGVILIPIGCLVHHAWRNQMSSRVHSEAANV